MATETRQKQNETEDKTFGRRRFLPGAYHLDFSVVRDTPLQMNGQPSTFTEVYRKLRESKLKEAGEDLFDSDEYLTEEGDIRLDGPIQKYCSVAWWLPISPKSLQT